MDASLFDQPFQDPQLAPVFEQVFAGRELGEHHGHALLATTDIYGVQRLALEAVANRIVSYRRSFRLQFTTTKEEAISAEVDALVAQASAARASLQAAPFTIDLHLADETPSRLLCHVISRLRDGFPGGSVRALTLAQFDELARRENLSYASLAATLAGTGLTSLQPSFADKIPATLLVALRTCTLGFGIVSKVSPADRTSKVRELLALKELSRTAGGIGEYVPVCSPPEQPEHSGFAELKTIAATRLMLRDVSRLTMLWGSTTWKMVQMSFAFGINHIDGLPLGSLDQMISADGKPNALEREVEHVITQGHRQPRAV